MRSEGEWPDWRAKEWAHGGLISSIKARLGCCLYRPPAKQVPPFEGELETSVTPSQESRIGHGEYAAIVPGGARGRVPRRSGRLKPARNFCDAAPRVTSLVSKEDMQGDGYQSGTGPRGLEHREAICMEIHLLSRWSKPHLTRWSKAWKNVCF